eukprot:85847-Amphidinium_carterae.1
MEVNQLNSMSGSQARAHFMDPMVDLSQVQTAKSPVPQLSPPGSKWQGCQIHRADASETQRRK